MRESSRKKGGRGRGIKMRHFYLGKAAEKGWQRQGIKMRNFHKQKQQQKSGSEVKRKAFFYVLTFFTAGAAPLLRL
ncbi:MAG: hypothetical protein M3R17_10670 [Bacteroidota bacterium]|nr:hypothetical protein [Bacteroidota bacterium]